MENISVKRLIFESIVDYHERWNYQPLRSEIHKVFSGLSDDVDLHLEQLAREGLLEIDADSGRIGLTPPCSASKFIRIQNSFRTGAPEAIAVDVQAIGLSVTSDLFAEVVCDDSMIDAGIHKDDIAIFHGGEPARGEIVAVKISGKTLLRRYLVIKNIPHLLAESRNCPDLFMAHETPTYGVLCCIVSPKLKIARNAASLSKTKVNYALDGPLNYRPTLWDVLGYEPSVSAPNPNSSDKVKKSRSARTGKDNTWPEAPSGNTLNERPERPYGHGLTQVVKEPPADQGELPSSSTDSAVNADINKRCSQEPATPELELVSKATRRRERSDLRV